MASIIAAAVLVYAFRENPLVAPGVLFSFLVAGAVMDSWLVACTSLAALMTWVLPPNFTSGGAYVAAWNKLGQHLAMFVIGVATGVAIDRWRMLRRNRDRESES